MTVIELFVCLFRIQSSYKYDFNESTVILTNPLFNNTMKTVIYIHGFLDGAFAESVKTVTRAYIERGDHNIIVVDWHADAIPGYFINAIFNMRKVILVFTAIELDFSHRQVNITIAFIQTNVILSIRGLVPLTLQLLRCYLQKILNVLKSDGAASEPAGQIRDIV